MAIDISSTTRRIVYTGSAGVGPYAFAFEVLAETDIAVYFNTTELTLTTDYTVSISADGTGSVTIVTGSSVPSTPTSSDRITIVGDRTIQRTTDFTTGGPLFATSLNDEFDSQTIFVQQVLEQSDRSLRAPNTDPTTINMTLPLNTIRANKTLAFDADGNPTTGEIVGNWRGNWAASTDYNKRDLVKDTTNNNVYICVTAHTSSGSLPLSTNADIAKWDLMVDAASATSSATAAASSATAAASSATAAASSASSASTSATTATTQASNASTSASSAATSATSASTSATSAASSASAAAAYVDNFDDTYLGAKASNPTLDNDGDPLQDGALYFDTTNDVMKVYDLGTTTWYQLTPTVSNQTNINTVAGIASDVTTIAGIDTNVTTVSGVSANVTTVAGVSADVTTVAGISGNVATVAGISSNVTTVAGNNANVTTVAGSIANVNTVATNISNVNSFSDIYRVSASAPTTSLDSGDLWWNSTDGELRAYDTNTSSWAATAPSASDQAAINVVAGDLIYTDDFGLITDSVTVGTGTGNVNTVATNIANVNTVAGISANVTTVAGISSDVTAVAAIDTAVSAVNANSSNINAVNANSTNINTVATNNTNINTVATNIANVNTVATNVADVNNFASVYRIDSSDPSTSLDEGDLVYNTTDNALKYYNGTAWVSIASGLTDIVNDTTPQLGGNLDAQNYNMSNVGTIDGTNLQLDFGGLS
jgi:hypothetical protein